LVSHTESTILPVARPLSVISRALAASSARPGDLHREMTDAARRGVDQHPLPGPHIGGVDQRLPGGQRRQRQRRGLNMRGPAGLRARCRAGEVAYCA
jgi:hypothetical protein